MDIKSMKQQAEILSKQGKISFTVPACVILLLVITCIINPYQTLMMFLYGSPAFQFFAFNPIVIPVYAWLLFLAILYSTSLFSAHLTSINLVDGKVDKGKWTDGFYVFQQQLTQAVIGMKIARFFRLFLAYALIFIGYGFGIFLLFGSLFSGDSQTVLRAFFIGVSCVLLSSIPLVILSLNYSLVDTLFYLRYQESGLEGTNSIFKESRRLMKGYRFQKWKLNLSFFGWEILSLFLLIFTISTAWQLAYPNTIFVVVFRYSLFLLLILFFVISFFLHRRLCCRKTITNILFAQNVLKEQGIQPISKTPL